MHPKSCPGISARLKVSEEALKSLNSANKTLLDAAAHIFKKKKKEDGESRKKGSLNKGGVKFLI